MKKRNVIIFICLIAVLVVVGVIFLVNNNNSKPKNNTTVPKTKDLIIFEEPFDINGLTITKVEINPNSKELKVYYDFDNYGEEFTLYVYDKNGKIGKYLIGNDDKTDGYVLINYKENLDNAISYSADYIPINSFVTGD